MDAAGQLNLLNNYFFLVMEFSKAVNKRFIHQLWQWTRRGCIAHSLQTNPRCVTNLMYKWPTYGKRAYGTFWNTSGGYRTLLNVQMWHHKRSKTVEWIPKVSKLTQKCSFYNSRNVKLSNASKHKLIQDKAFAKKKQNLRVINWATVLFYCKSEQRDLTPFLHCCNDALHFKSLEVFI